MSKFDQGFISGASGVFIGGLFAVDDYLFGLILMSVVIYLNYRWTKNS